MKKSIAIALVLLFAAAAWAQTEQTIYTFAEPNGATPETGLIEDGKGNFYGATVNGNGGTSGDAGTVYKLRRNAKGKWKQTVLYSFGSSGTSDGAYPQMPFLAIDKHGALYGTTPYGGAGKNGTVFKLTPGTPQWKETILYSFTGGTDGSQPIGGVTLDSKGNLYGTTFVGGGSTNCGSGCGVVYELSPGKKGSWSFSVLHAFTGWPPQYKCITYDGANPSRVTLLVDSTGNVIGTTDGGGDPCTNGGTIWELSPGGGNWTYSILATLGTPGITLQQPHGGVVMDSQGNLYGTDFGGYVAEFVKAQGYQPQFLYQPLNCNQQLCATGDYDTVSIDKAGNLYWTSADGAHSDQRDFGTVNELSPDGQGGWNYTLLYGFPRNPPTEGVQPFAGVTIDASGNLYGACTSGGGSQYPWKNGTVWEITP